MWTRQIVLKTIKQEGAGCPTLYECETTDGKWVTMRLRNGIMTIKLDNRLILTNHHYPRDGICSFEDFLTEALYNGWEIDESGAETLPSHIDDIERAVKKAFGDKAWIRITKDAYNNETGEQILKKGDKRTARIDTAEWLVENGYAVIEDKLYEKKRKTFYEGDVS